MIYGYVSQDFNSVDVLTQAIGDYAAKHQIKMDHIVVDPESNRVDWQLRQLRRFIDSETKPGDELVVYEASNIGRSVAQMIEFFDFLLSRGVNCHLVKYDMVFRAENMTNMSEMLTLIRHIESDFVAKRTTEALARRREKGLPLGRPKGRKNKSLKLDEFRQDIQRYLDLGVSKASIAKLIKCHPQTLYNYIDARGLKAKAGVAMPSHLKSVE